MEQKSLESTLKELGHLIYPISGYSMWPLLIDGDNVSIVNSDELKLFDIVLFKRNSNDKTYILHRIRKIIRDKYYIVGDNSSILDIVDKSQIIGKLDGVYKKEKIYSVTSKEFENINNKLINNPKTNIDDLINNREKLIFDRFDNAICELAKLFIDNRTEINLSKINTLCIDETLHLYKFLSVKKALQILGLISSKLNEICFATSIRQKIDQSIEYIKLRHLRRSELEKRIEEFFSKNQIKFMFVKGSEIRNLYPQPYMRNSTDIDLFVSNSDYEKTKKLFIKEFKAKMLVAENPYHDSFVIEEFKFNVEIHHLLSFDLPKEFKYLLDDPFENASVDINNKYRYHMDIDKYYLYHIVHAAKHIATGEFWLPMLADTYLLNQKYSLNKNIIKNANLDVFENSLLNVAKHLFSSYQLNDSEVKLLRYFYQDNFVNYIDLKKGKYQSKSSFLKSRFIVSRSYLVGKYPSLKKHPHLTFLYQIRRWFGLFKKGSIKKRKAELNAYDTNKSETFNWLVENGLKDYL